MSNDNYVDEIREKLDLPPWANSDEISEPVVMTAQGPVPFSQVPELIREAERRRAEMIGEPDPVPNDSESIHLKVIRDLEERRQFGLRKYGTVLQAGNGRDALHDAYEEALDLACYLRQAIEERDGQPSSSRS